MSSAATVAAVIVGSVLALISALHLAWSLGSAWPSKNRDALADAVIGRLPMPGALPCFVVAGAAAGACVLFLRLAVAATSPGTVRVGAALVAGAFLLRGSLGFFDASFRPQIRGSRYESLNRSFYSPLCMALGALAVVAVFA